MMKVKTRTVGHSTVVSVPKSFGIETGKEYSVAIDQLGTITFEPVDVNPFAQMATGALYEDNKDILIDDDAKGLENVVY
ncbi:type II toxin-antitoxin system PemI/MazE family antitoxin [Leuconostoc citreum]